MTFKTAAALSVAILLAGCAQAVVGPLYREHSKAPEDIAPIPPVTYQGWSCEQLYRETLRIDGAIIAATPREARTHRKGVFGEILNRLPSLYGRNVDPESARLKEQLSALDRVYLYKNCSVETAAIPAAPPLD